MSNRTPSLRRSLVPACLAAWLLLAAASVQAAALAPFDARYQASYMGMQANGRMTLAREDGNWKYQLNVRNQLADLTQTTVFDEHQGRLRPLSSSDRSVMLIKRRSVAANYDWSAAQATWSGDVKPERRGPVALQPGDMDALLINLAVVRDVAAGNPLAYRMVDEGRAKAMRYEVAGKEQITVSGKQRQATKVVRRDDKRETVAWIVAGLPVPARILQRENGQDTIDLTLQSVN
ncbi:hypothetical protein B1992_14145 [Pseudoxanthomonas broegbernensis]|uniref:DUF3108 domain-containing protein n=1 Tax=Pseudoxanthomonas broegbernensis TaxID=83619 RepID=A0A7V8GK60_9GAMM|nr:DUF3108 domain-containing protein [Pseudoxanthomonas broegbernensis]KAF1684854.1 hypothetical protein B1992_14145 [Pseudoxanthomonas broegbernensis]MBB6065271.1 hypothetical protein [Pseudoxanthomonas broegbernensis]